MPTQKDVSLDWAYHLWKMRVLAELIDDKGIQSGWALYYTNYQQPTEFSNYEL